jgi:hypothetical protein
LRLTRVFRELVRRTGLFVKHLSGRVRFSLALSRNLATMAPSRTYASTKPAWRCGAPTRPGNRGGE